MSLYNLKRIFKDVHFKSVIIIIITGIIFLLLGCVAIDVFEKTYTHETVPEEYVKLFEEHIAQK